MRSKVAILGILLVAMCSNCYAGNTWTTQEGHQPDAVAPRAHQTQHESRNLDQDGNQNPQIDKKSIDSAKMNFYNEAPVWINIALAFIALGTGIVISWQSHETRKAAEAATEQIKMMKASTTQWVELEPYDLFTKTEEEQPNPPTIVTIHPRWKVVNNSPLPLTLKKVAVQIAKNLEGWETYIFEYDEVVSPAKGDNHRAFFTPLQLNTAETKEFLSSGLELPISITIIFVGVSGVETTQHFGDMYFCKLGLLEVNHPIGKGPTRQYWEKDESPSMMVQEMGFRYLESDKDIRGSK